MCCEIIEMLPLPDFDLSQSELFFSNEKSFWAGGETNMYSMRNASGRAQEMQGKARRRKNRRPLFQPFPAGFIPASLRALW
jgi:hypothetical protein